MEEDAIWDSLNVSSVIPDSDSRRMSKRRAECGEGAIDATRSNMVQNIDTAAASSSLKLSSVGSPSPLRSPLGRRDSRDMSSSHRQSFSERGIPNSPRQRNPSLSQQAIQDLINNPPVGRKDDALPKFAGRDWRSITLGEILVPDESDLDWSCI
ncbi:hypothetical protein KCU94_g60, partial [Aureobasidium melanogenum]